MFSADSVEARRCSLAQFGPSPWDLSPPQPALGRTCQSPAFTRSAMRAGDGCTIGSWRGQAVGAADATITCRHRSGSRKGPRKVAQGGRH
eukprot:2861504-Pyramimonas_sp.AAC.1